MFRFYPFHLRQRTSILSFTVPASSQRRKINVLNHIYRGCSRGSKHLFFFASPLKPLKNCRSPIMRKTTAFQKVFASLFNSTLNHTIHNLLLSKQEYDDHRNHCQECCSKDQIPLLNIRTNKRLYSNRKSLNLTILS